MPSVFSTFALFVVSYAENFWVSFFVRPHKEGYPEVLSITHNEKSKGRENTWHSDVTWREEPSLGSILRMIEGPQVGGDTLFSDMCLAKHMSENKVSPPT